MKKIKTILVLCIILGINISALAIKDTLLISLLFLVICILSVALTSPRQTVKRLQMFIWMALSLLLFQLIFVRSMPFGQIVLQTTRVAMQLFIVSEVVRVGISSISPSSLISLFSFLPKQFQLLIAMTFYFIPLSIEEYGIIKHAQIARGLGNSIQGKLIAPFAFIIPLLHRVFQRSEIMTYSILSRGWKEE